MKFGKTLCFTLLAAMIATGFTGCNSGKNTNTTASGSKVTLTMWDYFEGANQQMAVTALVDSFNASQSKVTVKAVFTPRDEMNKQLSIGLVFDKLPDIALVDNCDMSSYVGLGMFADVTANFNKDLASAKDEFYPGPLKSCTYQNKYYGLPFGSNCIGLFYNKDMLSVADIANPPTTWDEMTADSAKLTKGGVYALAISAVNNEEGTFQFMPWLLSTGANHSSIGNDEAAKSYGILSTMISKGSMSKEVVNWTQADAEKQFATGKAAMMVNGPWNIATVQTDAPNLKFGITDIPKDQQFASVLGRENMGIIKGHHVDDAWQFLKFTANNENIYTDDLSYIPSRKDVAAADATIKNSNLLSAFSHIMTYASPRGPEPERPDISSAIYTTEQEALLGQKSPADAAKEA